MNSKSFETVSENEGVRQNTSDGSKIDKYILPCRSMIVRVYGYALLLLLVLFYFHILVIFDVMVEILHYTAWLLEHLGPKHTGKLVLLVCFFALLSAHVIKAAVWGLSLRWTQVLSSITEGVYYIDHNAVLRRHPADVSMETSRHADHHNRCADVWLFDSVPVRDSTGSLASQLGRR